MNLKKTLLLAIPAVALALGAGTLAALSGHQGEAIGVNAADYSRAERSLSVNEDGDVSATFDVENNTLDMKGWLLCLFSSKPSFDPNTRKVDGSNTLHPHSAAACAHYFFASSTARTGTMNITWAGKAADQKEKWEAGESIGEDGKTLKDYLDAGDWYLVIGPRHSADWADEDIEDKVGAGEGDYWENADYYVGLESNVLGDLPSGETYLDLSEFTDWEKDGAKFAVRYWDDDSHEGFSEFAAPVEGLDHIYLVSYELGFTPTHMQAGRLASSAADPASGWDTKWNCTQEFGSFYRHSVIGVNGYDNNGWLDKLAEVNVTDSDSIALDHYKRNGSKHSEHYSDSVVLAKDAEFDISYGGSHYSTITFHDSLEGVFAVKDGKITVGVADTYAFYFDTHSEAHSLYITTPVLAAADEWAQAFLADDCTTTKDNWDSSAISYNKLPDGSKALFLAEEHEPNPDKVLEGYVAQAVQRYDFVLTCYGTTGEDGFDDFMGRLEDEHRAPNQHGFSLNSKEGTMMMTIVVLGGVAIAAFAGLFILSKKRKGQAN